MGNKTLPITYDDSKPLAVVHHDPLNVLPFTRFFKDVKVITDRHQQWLHDLGYGDDIHSLDLAPGREHLWWDILRSEHFTQVVTDHLVGRRVLLYAPLSPPYNVNPLIYLMNSPTLANAYQNKRYFREELRDLIRIPKYVVKSIEQLKSDETFSQLQDQFGKFVLQDEDSSGSRATFKVRTKSEYDSALRWLGKNAGGRAIVVSQFIEGTVASIQVCITKYGIFNNGIQRQFIANPYLCNPELEGTAKWCGGELGAYYPEYVQHQADEIAAVVGAELSKHGYRGILGIDLIISKESEVFAIEVNARMTAYSQLVSDLQLAQGKIPFLLLHALEVGRIEYTVNDVNTLPSIDHQRRPVTYMIISNPMNETFTLQKYIRPGMYRLEDGRLEYAKSTYSLGDLSSENEVLIICKYNLGELVPRGAPILKVMKYGRAAQNGSDLNTNARHLIQLIRKQFELPDVTGVV